MELLSGDVPAGPGTLTNSNQARQSEFSKEKSQSFKYSFITFYYLLGLIGFMITVLNLLYRFPIGAHLSPVCPGLKNLKNLYEQNFSFDLHVFISENETNLVQKSELVWKKAELAYGDLGKVYGFSTNLSISEVSTVEIFFDKWNPPRGSSLESKTKTKPLLFSAYPRRV